MQSRRERKATRRRRHPPGKGLLLLGLLGLTATLLVTVPAGLIPQGWDWPRLLPPLPPLDGGTEQDNRPDFVPWVPGVIWSGPLERRAVALTFDDGPDAVSTPQLLALLREHGVVATFFLVGNRAELYSQLVRSIAAEGHEIANHTYSHPRMELLDDVQAMHEMRTTTQLLSRLARQPMRWFRPPYGSYNDDVLRWVDRAGLTTVMWSVDSRDWDGRSGESIVRRVTSQVRPGSIILLHCAAGASEHPYQTLAALPHIIAFLRAAGYELLTLSQLLEQG